MKYGKITKLKFLGQNVKIIIRKLLKIVGLIRHVKLFTNGFYRMDKDKLFELCQL